MSAPTLKSRWWSADRRALHSTTDMVTASASAARGPKSAAPASAPTALTEIVPVVHLERERLADPDERDDRDEPEDVRGSCRRRCPTTPAAMPTTPTRPTTIASRCESERKRGPVQRVRAAGGAARLGLDLERRRGPDAVLAVLGHRDEPSASLGGHEQRLGARVEDAVAALELRAVDGEVGLVDELVRVRAVAREPGDADRDGRADRLARRLDVEQPRRRRPADPLGDLDRLLGRRLRQQDRELLAAEAGRNVVVAELRAEDLRDPLQDGVAGEMAVGVVDVAQQVEVGHDQRQRPLEALARAQLVLERGREVARVEEAGLRVDARLGLERRHRRASGGSAGAARARTGSARGSGARSARARRRAPRARGRSRGCRT